MNKAIPFALVATFTTLAIFPNAVFAAESNQDVRAAAQTAATLPMTATVGQMLYGTDGKRIASIYRVRADGVAQVILNSTLVTVPASALSNVNGKLTSAIAKADLIRR